MSEHRKYSENPKFFDIIRIYSTIDWNWYEQNIIINICKRSKTVIWETNRRLIIQSNGTTIKLSLLNRVHWWRKHRLNRFFSCRSYFWLSWNEWSRRRNGFNYLAFPQILKFTSRRHSNFRANAIRFPLEASCPTLNGHHLNYSAYRFW